MEEIFYTAQKLGEAGYIDFERYKAFIEDSPIKAITWDGHAFLDNVRDTDVWKKTKSATSKVASVSINILSQVASGILTQMFIQ